MTRLFSNNLPNESKHEYIQNKVLNKLLSLSLVILVLFVFLIYKRSKLTNVGHIFIYADALGIVMILSLLIFRQLNNKIKVHIYIWFGMVVHTLGMLSAGYFAAGRYIFLLLVIVSSVFLSLRTTIILLCIAVVAYFLIAYMYSIGVVQYNFEVEEMSQSAVLWFTDGLVLLFIAVVVLVVIGLVFKAYKNEVSNLEKSELILYNTLQDLPIPTVIIDNNLNILFTNKTFEVLIGFGQDNVLTVRDYFIRMYEDVEHREILLHTFEEVASLIFKEGILPPVREYPYFDKDKNQRWTKLKYSLNDDKLVIMFEDTTESKTKRREVVRAMVNAEEEERSRMARELHDGLGPLVSTAKIYAHTLNKSTSDEQIRKQGDRLVELLDETLVEIRNISNTISPHILRNYGVKDGLRSFIEKVQLITQIKFQMDFDEHLTLSQTFEYTIYRTLVEMINNSIKHAKAKSIHISMKNVNNSLEIRYKDDGIGFDFERESGKGHGLMNIQSRIVNLGGSYDFKTSPGKGVDLLIKTTCNGSENCSC